MRPVSAREAVRSPLQGMVASPVRGNDVIQIGMRRLRHLLTDESGVSLVLAVVVLAFLVVIGTSVVSFSGTNSRSAEYSADRAAAVHLAEAGEAYARSILWAASDPTDANAIVSGTVAQEGGTVEYSGTYDSATQIWTLTGAGTLPNPTGGEPITQTVTSQVQVTGSGGAESQPWAIFVGDSSCDGFSFLLNGGEATIVGAIHSNGDLEINGDNITAGYVSTHGDPCKSVVGGSNIDLGDGSTEPVVDTTTYAWPVEFEESDFTCTFSASTFEFTSDGATIPSGTYCASDLFKIDANNVNGQITVLSPNILINGNDHELTPYENGVLFYSTGSNEMLLNGTSYDWEGIIYHPSGRVKINGDATSSLTGTILAHEVEVNGSGFNMQATGSAGYVGVGGTFSLENVSGSYYAG